MHRDGTGSWILDLYGVGVSEPSVPLPFLPDTQVPVAVMAADIDKQDGPDLIFKTVDGLYTLANSGNPG